MRYASDVAAAALLICDFAIRSRSKKSKRHGRTLPRPAAAAAGFLQTPFFFVLFTARLGSSIRQRRSLSKKHVINMKPVFYSTTCKDVCCLSLNTNRKCMKACWDGFSITLHNQFSTANLAAEVCLIWGYGAMSDRRNRFLWWSWFGIRFQYTCRYVLGAPAVSRAVVKKAVSKR